MESESLESALLLFRNGELFPGPGTPELKHRKL